MEFTDNECSTFDEVMELLKKHPIFKSVKCKRILNYLFPEWRFTLSTEKYIVMARKYI